MRMTVSFLLKKSRVKSNGEAPVYVRIVLNCQRVELSVGVSVHTDKWDSKGQRVIGRSELAKVLNNKLDKVKAEVFDIYNQLNAFEKEFDVWDIKTRLIKVDEGKYIGVVSVFDYYLNSMKDKLHKSFSMETYKHYRSSKNRVDEFIKYQYKINDYPVGKIDYNFLDKFDRYLKSKYKVHQNTAWNYHKHLRRILNLAISLEHIEKNPYGKYKVRLANVSHLAKEFNVTKPTISDAVKALELKKLIKKTPSSNDKRAYTILLTSQGKKMVKATEQFANPFKETLDQFTSNEQKQLFNHIVKIIFTLNRKKVLTVQRMCYNCRFYEKIQKGHFCRLMDTKLQDEDIRLDCPEYEGSK